jgi:RNA polymerase sigma factor (sigma-70 family)
VTRLDDATARFTALYRTYYRVILSTCTRRLGTPQAAEDATHEVFRIAWQHMPKENLDLAWLYTTARNVVGNEYRRTKRFNAAASRLECPDVDPPDLADALDVRTAMRRLRPVDRELLYMAYWEGLTAPEISKVLGVSTPAVWVRLTRAREALRRLLPAVEPCRGRDRRR